jgi:(S)-ureidoglycine aminohydrolase
MIKAPTELFGHTRARVAARHALITPANHVSSVVPGISGAAVVVLASGALGANFLQLLVAFERGGRAAIPEGDTETFGYFVSGGGAVAVGGRKRRCGPGCYFFAPAGTGWSLAAPKPGTRVVLFRKKYVPLSGAPAPLPLIGDAARVKGEPFLGDPDAMLQALLPDGPSHDMAVNRFTYRPGAHLPYVEVHVMEHGLLMLAGKGVYRLDESWYPVQAGDAIWMAPYCPQWFVAMGREPASYLYFKDVNRAVL